MLSGERKVWINGQILPESQAKVSVFDRGFVYGDAAYDVTRTYRHKIFRLNLYLERFFNALRYMRIDPGVTQEELAQVISMVLDLNLPLISENHDFQVIMRCSRGTDYRSDLVKPGNATLMVLTDPLRINASSYSEGVELITPSIRRTPAEALSPECKTHDRLNNVLAELDVKKVDPSAKALMLDIKGLVAEGSSFNIAAVVDDVLVSPQGNCLEGRTMKVLMELAGRLGISSRFDNLSLYQLYDASEAFVTLTSAVMFPVKSVNGRKIGGRNSRTIQEKLWAEWDMMVGLDVREQARRYLSTRPMIKA